MSVEQQLETWQRRTQQQYSQLKRVIASEGRDYRGRLEELEHDRTAQQVQIDAYAFEGAADRIALEELSARVERLERRYLALEHAVGVFAGTGDAAALFEFVRRADQDARGTEVRS